jgi:hypothetical protein
VRVRISLCGCATLGNQETNVTPEPVIIVTFCVIALAKEFGETREFALKFKTPLLATEQLSSPFLTCLGLGFRVCLPGK